MRKIHVTRQLFEASGGHGDLRGVVVIASALHATDPWFDP